MIVTTFLDNVMQEVTPSRLFFAITTSADSIAIFVPVPTAIPISAAVKAGASLIPSPTIATRCVFLRSITACAFPSGKTSAITFSGSMSSCFATAFATTRLSPVSI